jgi:autoinducer 2-degrading protein
MYESVLIYRVLPQFIDDYVTNMRICAEASSKEPGCIRYEVMQDVADPSMVCLLQIFKDAEAYQAHQDAPHHVHWVEISAPWRDRSVVIRHEMKHITPIMTNAAV